MKIAFIQKLISHGYVGIGVKYKEIELFYKEIGGACHCIMLIDYQDTGSSPISTEFLRSFKDSVINYLESRGMEQIHMLGVVTTYSEYVAEDLIEGLMPYWVLDVYHDKVVMPEGQPQEFGDLRSIVERMNAGEVQNANKTGDTSGGRIVVRPGSSYKNRLINFNNLMILINVVTFCILESMGSTLNSYFMLEHGAFYWPAVNVDGEYYRFFTCMFLHFGFEHLFSNMIVLYFLGDNLERAFGGKRYLTIYLGTGLVAAFVSCGYYLWVNEQVLSCGASGAIFGVIGALVYIVWTNNGKLEDLSVWRLVLFVGFSFYSGFTSTGVDNAAHVGGFIAGMILAKLLYISPELKNEKNDYISRD